MPPPPEYNEADYLSAPDTAKRWKVSATYVRALCRSGRVPGAIQVSSREGPGARLLWRIPRTIAETYEVPGS
jgi:hypothetical protein